MAASKHMPWIVPLAFLVSVVAGLMAAGGGPGYRLGVLDLPTAFAGMRYGAYVGIGGAVLGLVAAILVRPGSGRRGFVLALVAVLVGAAAFYGPTSLRGQARSVPPIHDISTDTEDPPAFVAVVPLRAGAANPPDYAGPETAAQQRDAYPDLAPLNVPLPPAEAVRKAEAAARDLGWDIVAVEPAEGRMEATATTAWFGFKDDVVVRIRPEGDGSRVDVRSKSRVGRSDLGANAARIRDFLARLK